MTAADFRDAADDAAERETEAYIGSSESAAGHYSGFTAGAEWGLAHLAAHHRATADQARADGDPGRAHLHEWAADYADTLTEEDR